jgi:hypothetical protein
MDKTESADKLLDTAAAKTLKIFGMNNVVTSLAHHYLAVLRDKQGRTEDAVKIRTVFPVQVDWVELEQRI